VAHPMPLELRPLAPQMAGEISREVDEEPALEEATLIDAIDVPPGDDRLERACVERLQDQIARASDGRAIVLRFDDRPEDEVLRTRRAVVQEHARCEERRNG